VALGVLVAGLALGPGAWAAQDEAPALRPATREQAVTVFTGGAAVISLTPLILAAEADPHAAAAVRRAVRHLEQPLSLPRERRLMLPDGTVLRFTASRTSFDRIDPRDDNRDGRPDLLEAALAGLTEARGWLVEQLGLPELEALEVVLGHIGNGVDSYLVPTADRRARMVLEATEATPDETVRRAAVRQYAFATALAAGIGSRPAWAEALATWTVIRLTGGPHGETAELLSARLARLAEGLETDRLDLAGGNAIWFAFLEAAYGATTVRLTVQELAGGDPVPAALDRALARGAGESLGSAFREFHVWALLVGDRAEGRHFPFAERLHPPVFAASVEGLPALSVQGDPLVAPVGGAWILLRPEAAEEGLRLHFDGDLTTTWEADILLVDRDGALHRVAVPLARGRGEVTVPLQGLREAVLLVRNLGGDPEPRRFSWAADLERGYPVEFAVAGAARSATPPGRVLVSWETRSERNLLGFDILRSREEGAAPVRINPVWIPALGEGRSRTSYQFLDPEAEPGTSYVYRIRAVTLDGLATLSEPLVLPE
jgi:hypothetical protein